MFNQEQQVCKKRKKTHLVESTFNDLPFITIVKFSTKEFCIILATPTAVNKWVSVTNTCCYSNLNPYTHMCIKFKYVCLQECELMYGNRFKFHFNVKKHSLEKQNRQKKFFYVYFFKLNYKLCYLFSQFLNIHENWNGIKKYFFLRSLSTRLHVILHYQDIIYTRACVIAKNDFTSFRGIE